MGAASLDAARQFGKVLDAQIQFGAVEQELLRAFGADEEES